MVRRILPDEPETEDFQNGAVVGYHACGVDIAAGHLPEGDEGLELNLDLAAAAKPGEHSEEWYAGYFGGYRVRRAL